LLDLLSLHVEPFPLVSSLFLRFVVQVKEAQRNSFQNVFKEYSNIRNEIIIENGISYLKKIFRLIHLKNKKKGGYL